MILTLIILVLFVGIFYRFYGNKKGFDTMLTKWLIFYITVSMLYFYSPNKYYILLLLTFKHTRIPLVTVFLVLLSLLGGRFSVFRIASIFLFNSNLNLNINSKLPTTPTIIMANYPANYCEYLVQGLFGDKICLVVHGPAIKILQFIHGKKRLIPVNGKNQFYLVEKEVRKKIQEGYHIFCYVEKEYHNRKNKYAIDTVRSGMFSIAKNVNCTITPIVVDHISNFNGVIDNFNFNIFIDKTRYVKDVKKEVDNVTKLYRNKLRKFSFK